MSKIVRTCCICAEEADWERVRMPNSEQMTFLCHRHYQSLQARNPVLAGYYETLAAQPPMQMPSASSQDSRSYGGGSTFR